MDVNFINWMVGYADGFEWFDNDILRFRYHNLSYDWIISGIPGIKAWCFHPLLLQRTIEGINKTVEWVIRIKGPYSIEIIDKNSFHYFIPIELDIDEAKIAALKYIKEYSDGSINS